MCHASVLQRTCVPDSLPEKAHFKGLALTSDFPVEDVATQQLHPNCPGCSSITDFGPLIQVMQEYVALHQLVFVLML